MDMNDSERGTVTVEHAKQPKQGIPNALTGVSPSNDTPLVPVRYETSNLDVLIFNLKKALLEVEGKDIDDEYFHNQVYGLLDYYYKEIAQKVALLEQQGKEIKQECLKASNKAISVIGEWRYEVRDEHQDAARLRDQTAKLVANLKSCDTEIKAAVAKGIEQGITRGNRIVIAAAIIGGLNVLALAANVVMVML
jgi:hypothetical protein